MSRRWRELLTSFGQRFQTRVVTANHCFLFLSGPAFELTFAPGGGHSILVALGVHQVDWATFARIGGSATDVVFAHASSDVVCLAYVE